MKAKKIIILVLCCVLSVITLAACGKKGGEPEPTPPPTPDPPVIEKTECDRLDMIERLMMDVATVDVKTREDVDRWDEPVIFTLGGEYKKLIYDDKILQGEYSVDDIIIWCDKIINFLREKGY